MSDGPDPVVDGPPVVGPLTLVVPVFNEAHRFRHTASLLADYVRSSPDGRLVFVDDGSTDGTPDLIRAFIRDRPGERIELLTCPHRGKGAALEAGLATAKSGIAAFCDIDLATPLPELSVIIDAATRAPVLAIGSRGTAASRLVRRQRRTRELLGRAYNRAIQLSVVPGVADTQCGAKAADVAIWSALQRHSCEEGFAWDVEIIAIARALDIPVQEVGIEWRHQDGSRVRPARDGLRMLRAIPRIRATVATLRDVDETAPATRPGVFGDDNALRLSSADVEHWWFRSKAAFVSLCIRRYSRRSGLLVDVGAGSAGVTAMLGWPPKDALALDGNFDLVSAARHRHSLLTAVSDAGALPLRDGVAAVVCVLDVIEHVSDPGAIVREAARLVGADGCVIVNVPAHPWLWSEADEVLGHVRRYTRRSLRRELARNDLEVVWISHVFSWLALPVWLRRRGRGESVEKLGLDVSSRAISWTSMVLTRVEGVVTRFVSLPIGTSVLCVARVAIVPPFGEEPLP